MRPTAGDETGETVVVGGEDGVHVFTETAPAGVPSASHAALTGLAIKKPELAFKVAAGSNAPPIKTLAVSLPRGLSITANRKQLANDLVVTDSGKYTFSASQEELVVTVSKPVRGLSLTIRAGALSESKTLLNRVRQVLNYNQVTKHHAKRELTVHIGVRVTDAARASTRLILRITIR
jgi:hypothetical protein